MCKVVGDTNIKTVYLNHVKRKLNWKQTWNIVEQP
jgi:hypothetical protein